jgi:hypothetical protein
MKIIYLAPLFISCILCLQYPLDVDKRIRLNLISALKNFRQKVPHPCLNKPVLKSLHRIRLERLPMDLMAQTVGSFLRFKSIASLRKVSIDYKQISYLMVKFRLAKFCPYFVFDDLFLNDLLLYVIDEHFLESSNLSSPSIQDELQLLILKFNFSNLNYNLIPRNIYFYLIAFINEVVHGVNSTVPFTQDSCLMDSIRFISAGDFPKTLNYLRNLGVGIFYAGYYENLEFFALRPTKEEIKNKFQIDNVNTWHTSIGVFDEFQLLISESLIDDFNPDSLVDFCNFTAPGSCYISPIINGRLLEYINANLVDPQSLSVFRMKFEIKMTICAKYPESDSICEILTRRIISDMPLEDEPSLNLSDSSHIENILTAFMYFDGRSNLYQVNLYSLCHSSPQFSKEMRPYYIRSQSYNSMVFYFEAMIKDHAPVIYYNHVDNVVVSSFSIVNLDIDFLEVFFDLLSPEDPFILLFIMSKECLYYSKRYIVDKFDLNRSYRFEAGTYKSLNILGYYFSEVYKGKTVHFKQIIKELDDPRLQEVFSSNPDEFRGKFLTTEPVTAIGPNMDTIYFTAKELILNCFVP